MPARVWRIFKRQQADCTSFAWANRGTPLEALKWLFSSSAPLLFRPQFDLHQWLWSLKFLAQCNDTAFKRNVQLLVAVGACSHQSLKEVVADSGIDYHRLERGIGNYFSDAKAFASASGAAGLMRKYDVNRQVVSTEALLKI